MNQRRWVNFVARVLAVGIGLCAGIRTGRAQQAQPPEASRTTDVTTADSLRELRAEIVQLRAIVQETKKEAAKSREEVESLREELRQTKGQLDSLRQTLPAMPQGAGKPPEAPAMGQAIAASPASPNTASPIEERISKLEEDQRLLKSELGDQNQVKVESASKYRVRLSGIALLNVMIDRGKVDNTDLPSVALARGPLDPSGNFSATMRQTELGLEVFGPKFAGAQSSGHAQFDFFGGFPQTANGVSTGLIRMRTATFRLDWPHTSLVMGQDAPFFSPLSPSSIASLAVPALAYAGNLWTWTPQVRIERYFDVFKNSGIEVQGGILDPLSGEPPESQFYRAPQPGEGSRQPAYAARIAWEGKSSQQPFSIGLGGYYSRQQYGMNRNVDAWAGMADWSVPMGRLLSLTGEFYRGRALGGLGGGIGRSVVFSGPVNDPASALTGLNDAGGWAQLKFKPTETLEFNTAIGEDDSFAQDLRRFASPGGYFYSTLASNQSELVNVIYGPRSDLVFSIEYRKLKTRDLYGHLRTADHINLGAGILF